LFGEGGPSQPSPDVSFPLPAAGEGKKEEEKKKKNFKSKMTKMPYNLW